MAQRQTAPAPLPAHGNEDPRVSRSRAAGLRAARSLLVEEGWAAVTHVRVAERSGLGRATVYRHWPSPAALLHDAVEDEAAEDTQIEPTGELRGDLIAVLGAVRFAMVDRRLAGVLATLMDRAEWDPQFRDVKADLVDKGASMTRQVVVDAVERGDICPPLSVGALIAQLVGPLVYQRLMSGEPITDAFIEMIVDGFLAAHTVSADVRRR